MDVSLTFNAEEMMQMHFKYLELSKLKRLDTWYQLSSFLISYMISNTFFRFVPVQTHL